MESDLMHVGRHIFTHTSVWKGPIFIKMQSVLFLKRWPDGYVIGVGREGEGMANISSLIAFLSEIRMAGK